MLPAANNTLAMPGQSRLMGILASAIILFALLLPQAALPAEEADLMERWLESDSLSSRTVDHAPWQAILATYASTNDAGEFGFDYGAVSEADKTVLNNYIATLSRTDVDRLKREEQLAYWINAYNAIVVSIVLADYPVKSINDIDGWFLSPGPWKAKRFRVYQIDLSLNDIYHRILRPIWNDPRIHYALGCAARGCPAISPAPYTGASIENDLEAAARAYINRGPAVLFIKGNGATISRLYDWYEQDFGRSDAEIMDHIRSFADDTLMQQLAPVEKISGHGFDWALNTPR